MAANLYLTNSRVLTATATPLHWRFIPLISNLHIIPGNTTRPCQQDGPISQSSVDKRVNARNNYADGWFSFPDC